ncbi:MAG: septum formation inhibitor Maf [Gammaproteobacteria bacterium]|nr:MAG: septum formation inhibitor Maf [Gammaproteobacteria bacterium]
MNNIPLVLASSSPYRRELLLRLRLSFDCVSPNCDETSLKGEAASTLAARLALLKAKTVAKAHPDALIISSDQVVEANGELLGKPGGHAEAVEQLSQLAGKMAIFYTSLCLLNAHTGQAQQSVEPVEVQFKPLSAATIEAYLRAEQPYDCAGAFKSEGLGTILLESIQSQDPTTLIGLPLIRLCQFLEHEGVQLV